MVSVRLISTIAAVAFIVVFLIAHVFLRVPAIELPATFTSSYAEPSTADDKHQLGQDHQQESQARGSCDMKLFSSFRCIPPASEPAWTGDRGSYGFPIFNRSCVYENVVFEKDHVSGYPRFVLFLPDAGSANAKPPFVSLSSRPFDLPQMRWKSKVVYRKMVESHRWAPEVRDGPVPCDVQSRQTEKMRAATLAYYSPIVAPWNVAHTLLCDLFGLFWAAFELLGGDNNNKNNNSNTKTIVPLDMQIVAYGKHYSGDFPFPLKKGPNVAFNMMSQLEPLYDNAGSKGLQSGLYGRLLAGIGTKSWSWVTPEYRASGSPHLWYEFRKHIMRVVGITKGFMSDALSPASPSSPTRPIRVSICHKKNDKRGITNYEETVSFLQDAARHGEFGAEVEVEFVLETSVGLPVKKQVELMLRADVYMCNEGTLSTPFFLMSPGKVYLSLPLVQHGPHLHQKHLPKYDQWWRLPDPLRPDPRKNIGGNIDWFPQAIPWVKSLYYDYVPMNETRIQPPCAGCLRNYMPDFNIIVQRNRIVPLMKKAIAHVASNKDRWREILNNNNLGRVAALSSSSDLDTEAVFEQVPPELLSDTPNYSVTADICRQMMHKIVQRRLQEKKPYMDPATPFNTARCLYGMSWLCEFWANTNYRWRFFHGKWRYGHCGGIGTAQENLIGEDRIDDPRERRPLSEFLFYTKEELLHMYNSSDFGRLNEQPDELDVRIFASNDTIAGRSIVDQRRKLVEGTDGAADDANEGGAALTKNEDE